MIVTTALLLTALYAGPPQDPVQSVSPVSAQGVEEQRISTGIILASAVEGRIAIFDSHGRLVVELDKPAGRSLEVALEPGAYEVRFQSVPPVVRFQVRDGDRFVLEPPRTGVPAPVPPQPAPPAGAIPAPPAPARALDARHRIEVRFGGWADGWAGDYDDCCYSGSAHGAFGVEYLHFLRNDLGVGMAVTGYGTANGWSYALDGEGTSQALVSLPVVVRWYPVRRLTQVRAVEPYVTAGIGPAFGVNSAWVDYGHPHGWTDWQDWRNWPNWDDWDDWDHGVSSTRVSTALGGRIGGGVDFRLGSVFTLGLSGAWNWNTGFADDLWYRPDPSGGEFTVTMGWQFGR